MNGIFAVNKPTGPTSQDVVGKLKRIFMNSEHFVPDQRGMNRRKPRRTLIKIGHGGTLDPLASGVLVIGVGTGTKQLAGYLGKCTKVYRATALLGCATTTYDSEGAVHQYGTRSPQSVTDEDLQAALKKFRGELKQKPPVYSALKMDGKPLYEYARENKPLPRPIEERECEIIEISGKLLKEEKELPTNVAPESEREFISSVQRNGTGAPDEESKEKDKLNKAIANGLLVELTFSVSSGTYIRSLIHDIGVELGTNAHMTKLERIRQGDWELGRNVLPLELFDGDKWWPQLDEVLKEGPKVLVQSSSETSVQKSTNSSEGTASSAASGE